MRPTFSTLVVDKDTIDIADIIPDAVGEGQVDDQIVTAGDAVALVENFHRGGVISGDLLDIVAGENVLFQQRIIGTQDIDAFGAGITYPAIADG